MARFVRSYSRGRASAATVDGLGKEAIESEIAGRNGTIQYREDGVDVSTKGGIEYVNFTGAGVTASNPSAGLLQVDVPAGVVDGDKGDITVSASGATWTIDNDVVTFAKMQDVATAKLLGRATGGTGNIEEITLGTNLSYTGTTLNAAGGGISDGDKGDITVSGGGATWTIDNNVVSNTQMATMGISTVKANITGSVTNPQDVDIETGFKPTLALVKADVGLGSVVNADTTTTANITDSANKRFVTDAQQTVIGNTSGTNTGDQTSIVGISGTKAQFDTAVSDGNFTFDGDNVNSLVGGNWKVFYTDGSGAIIELALGANGTVLQSNGATSAPTFATPSGGSGLTQPQVMARSLGC